MKENKKAILEILKKKSSKKEGKKDDKFESLVLNLALQKIDSDDFDYDLISNKTFSLKVNVAASSIN